jgi:hypothetical protein
MVVSPYSQCRHQPARRPLRNADNRSPPRRGGQQSNQQTKSKTVRPEQNTPRKSAEPISRSIQRSQLSFAQLKLLSRPRDSGRQRQGGVGTARPWSRSSAALRSPFPPPSHNSPSIARRSSISEIPRPSKPPRYETITPCDQSSSMRTQSRKAPRALAHKVSRLPKAIRAYEQHYYLKGERGER